MKNRRISRAAYPRWVAAMPCLALLLLSLPCRSGPANTAIEHTAPIASRETLHYGVEWRLIRAGIARVSWTPALGDRFEGALHLESAGMVSKLYKVNDDYSVHLADQLCADRIHLKALEGKRNRETKITFDRKAGKAHYLERDLIKNSTVLEKQTDVPACVQDVVAGLYRMRTLRLEPGQSGTIPITDGKKFANAKVEAQERETIKTPTGTHKTIRHEAYIFNGVLYAKNARCLVWLTDDARRTPVQIQVRMRFLIGTITLTLEKEERI
jgi:hypothetical protein